MRVAVLSDIHSNYHAFLACYEDALEHCAECFIFLGDYVSDLAMTREVLDLVYEIRSKYPTVCLRGNREKYMLDCADGIAAFARGSKTGSLLYTYQQLRQKDLDFFRQLRISDTVKLEGITVEIAHAAMDNDRYYFDSKDGRAAHIFPKMKYDYLLTGHCHKQYAMRQDGKTILNPGSVGVPHGGSRSAKYALLDIADGSLNCKLREVAYDIEAAIRSQFDSGLVRCAGFWAIGILHDLITGQERTMALLACVEQMGDPQDEDVWRRAATYLGMKLTEQDILAFYQATLETAQATEVL